MNDLWLFISCLDSAVKSRRVPHEDLGESLIFFFFFPRLDPLCLEYGKKGEEKKESQTLEEVSRRSKLNNLDNPPMDFL